MTADSEMMSKSTLPLDSTKFNGYVADIFSLVTWEVKTNFVLMSQLSSVVTSTAHLSNSPFPYLTISEFEVWGGYLAGLSGMITVAFAPLIAAENQTAWEEYSVDNQYWIAEAARFRQNRPDLRDPIDGHFHGHGNLRRRLEFGATSEEKPNAQSAVVPLVESGGSAQAVELPAVPRIFEKIYSMQDGEQVPYAGSNGELLAPVWQIAPTPGDDPKMVNFNLLADPFVADLFNVLVRYKETVLSKALEVDYLFDASFGPEEKIYKKQPHSYVAEPVYDSFEPGAEMVGFLLSLTSWESLFTNILPEGANGIVCVVKSSCGDEFSFNLEGPNPVFLGYGDIHDENYDKYGQRIDIEDYPKEIEGLCLHTLTVYPSVELRASYNTSNPTIYTSVFVLAFVVAALLLFLYDRLVTRRQKEAAADVARKSAIVSSLFPANVRDRLFQPAEKNSVQRSSTKLSSDNSDGFNEQNDYDGDDETMPFKSKPIADFFPEVSIMFADIVGKA